MGTVWARGAAGGTRRPGARKLPRSIGANLRIAKGSTSISRAFRTNSGVGALDPVRRLSQPGG
jgi:hypothetical protein